MIEKRESRPNPDPTERTIEQAQRETANLKELFETHLDGIKKEIIDVHKSLDSNFDLIIEKFAGVKTEFTMRDIALAAAFKAAESAVKQQNESNTLAIDKAGTAFTKQIDSLDEKIDDLKQRISDLGRKDWAAVGGYLVGVIGVIALIVEVIRHT